MKKKQKLLGIHDNPRRAFGGPRYQIRTNPKIQIIFLKDVDLNPTNPKSCETNSKHFRCASCSYCFFVRLIPLPSFLFYSINKFVRGTNFRHCPTMFSTPHHDKAEAPQLPASKHKEKSVCGTGLNPKQSPIGPLCGSYSKRTAASEKSYLGSEGQILPTN